MSTLRVMLQWGQGAIVVLIDGDDIGGGHGPNGFDEEDALVLAADAAAALILDDVNGGNGGGTVFGGAFKDAVARAGTVGASEAGTLTMCGGGSNYGQLAS